VQTHVDISKNKYKFVLQYCQAALSAYTLRLKKAPHGTVHIFAQY